MESNADAMPELTPAVPCRYCFAPRKSNPLRPSIKNSLACSDVRQVLVLDFYKLFGIPNERPSEQTPSAESPNDSP